MLVACSNRDPYVTSAGETPSGSWRIFHQVDKITGAELPSASVRALASQTYVANAAWSVMQLTCFDKQPIVRFGFEFKIGTSKDTILGYRFDDKPGHESVAARVVAGDVSMIIDNPVAVAEFVNEMTGSKKVYVRIRSMAVGRTTAEYPLDGSAPALQAAFAGCPVMIAQPNKRTS
jgi:hypothetical protein